MNTQHNPVAETGPIHVDTSDFEPVEGAKGPQEATPSVVNLDSRPNSRKCQLVRFQPDVPCDLSLPLVRCHLIDKQRLRKAGLTEEEVWDPRVWIWGCDRHHHRMDQKFAPKPITAALEEYASEHNFTYMGERDGWRYCEPAPDLGQDWADELVADEERLRR